MYTVNIYTFLDNIIYIYINSEVILYCMTVLIGWHILLGCPISWSLSYIRNPVTYVRTYINLLCIIGISNCTLFNIPVSSRLVLVNEIAYFTLKGMCDRDNLTFNVF